MRLNLSGAHRRWLAIYNTALTDAAAWALVAELGSIGGTVTVLDNE